MWWILVEWILFIMTLPIFILVHITQKLIEIIKNGLQKIWFWCSRKYDK